MLLQPSMLQWSRVGCASPEEVGDSSVPAVDSQHMKKKRKKKIAEYPPDSHFILGRTGGMRKRITGTIEKARNVATHRCVPSDQTNLSVKDSAKTS